jgi:ABC-type antimicrobial peptide transport system permease subunit
VAAASLVRSFLFQVSPFDPAVLVLAAIGVFALALGASTLPAQRAASVDPMQALRGEQVCHLRVEDAASQPVKIDT